VKLFEDFVDSLERSVDVVTKHDSQTFQGDGLSVQVLARALQQHASTVRPSLMMLLMLLLLLP